MPGDGFRIRLDAHFETQDRRSQQDDVRDGLGAWREARGQQVGVEVAREQSALEEDEAGGPDCGRSAEEREQLTGGDRFEQKEQERREKGDGRVEEGKQLHPRAGLRLRPPSLYSGEKAVYRGPAATGAGEAAS